MSNRLPVTQRDHLLNDNGPYRSIVVDGSSTSTDTADGSWNKPYLTIQEGLDALPDPAVDALHSRIGTAIHIIGGEYDESPVFSGEGIFYLVPHGVVVLIGPAAAPRNFTYSATGGGFLNALLVQSASTDNLVVSGNFIVTDGAGGFNVDVDLKGVNITGDLDFTTLAGVGSTEFTDLKVGGSFTGPTTFVGVASRCQFFGPINILRFDGAAGCIFSGDVTVAVAGTKLFHDCAFSGTNTFTGPVGSLRFDAMSDYTFTALSWVAAGGVVKEIIGGPAPSAATAPFAPNVVVVDFGAAPAGDGTWETPYETLQAAFDAKPAQGTDATVDAYGWNILLMPGNLTASATFTGEGTVTLTSLGRVVIDGNLNFVFDGNTDFNNNVVFNGGWAGGPADFSGLVITGNVDFDNPGFTFDGSLSMKATKVDGTITTFGWEGTLALFCESSFVGGTVTHGGAGIVTLEGLDTTFNGSISLTSIPKVVNCLFQNSVTVTDVLDVPLVNCEFAPGAFTFTGATGDLLMDAATHFSFSNSGWFTAAIGKIALTDQPYHHLTFTTASLAFGIWEDNDIPIEASNILILGVEVTRIAGTAASVSVTLWNDAVADPFTTYQTGLIGDEFSGVILAAGGLTYGPRMEGTSPIAFAATYHDYKNADDLHIRVLNTDGALSGTFKVQLKYMVLGVYP